MEEAWDIGRRESLWRQKGSLVPGRLTRSGLRQEDCLQFEATLG